VAEAARPVDLVGWSLGGTIARETARLVPQAVGQVVTYGTPVVGGPTHTLGASAYGRAECERISALIRQLDAESPIAVPMTAIFTRRDSVVSWGACIDHSSPVVHHVEVGSTHFSMGIDPDVWRVVAERLAASPSSLRRPGREPRGLREP
jgi:dienelactone hydrolase